MIALTRNKGGVSVCQYGRKVMRTYIINQLKELGTIITGSLVSRKAKLSASKYQEYSDWEYSNICSLWTTVHVVHVLTLHCKFHRPI